jgi:hypothetical protein
MLRLTTLDIIADDGVEIPRLPQQSLTPDPDEPQPRCGINALHIPPSIICQSIPTTMEMKSFEQDVGV